MNSIDLFLMGIRNLWRRKARTFLTVLGVIIGTTAIIVMVSLGLGMERAFMEQMEQMGSLTNIEVYKNWEGGGDTELNQKAIDTFKKIPNVSAVLAQKSSYMKISTGKYMAELGVNGVDLDALEAFGFETTEGRLLEETDKNGLLMGAEAVNEFYNPRKKQNRWEQEVEIDFLEQKRMVITTDHMYGEPVQDMYGDMKRPKPHDTKVVGILAESQDIRGWGVYMDINDMQKILETDAKVTGQKFDKNLVYDQVTIKVNDMENVAVVSQTIKDMGYQSWSMTDMLEDMRNTARTIQLVLAGIGAVSLFVAAIGITNTMVMSIYERTREIGVMKVLGARLVDIKRLFLFEAALIGGLGGLVGLGLSFGVSNLINKLGQGAMGMGMGMGETSGISYIPVWLAGAAIAFSMLIGVISGYYPARRAMNLSALDAIRTE
jgi:ABC-type antimicrobial peptide transport system permease subunit